MFPELYWIDEVKPLRLAIMARPRADDWLRDEIVGWQSAGISTVVSLLESHEVCDLGLKDESSICAEFSIDFLVFPVPDRGTPASIHATALLVSDVVGRLRHGDGVGVHCRAGIGRSGLLVACVLLKLGVPFQEVFPMLSRARKLTVPDTPAQIDWAKNFALSKTGE